MTGPQLLALANGIVCNGQHRCIFCGAPATRSHTLSESFTTRDTLKCPGSQFACDGCFLCLEEVGDAVYHTGETYRFTKAFRRMCSWVVTDKYATAATKGHLDYLRRICIDPPSPPFTISLAVSGQKHVMYRSVVNHDVGSITVTLEGEPVTYRCEELAARLTLCGRLVSATGKPALAESPKSSLWFRVCERFADGEAYCSEWERVRNEPLSRLAAFLSPAKEVAEREHPGDGHNGIPSEGSGPDRPEPKNRRGGNRQHQRGGQASLFGSL